MLNLINSSFYGLQLVETHDVEVENIGSCINQLYKPAEELTQYSKLSKFEKKDRWIKSGSPDFEITPAGCLVSYHGNDKDVVIPEGVLVIAEHAFYKSECESVKFPDSLLFIDEYSFHGCKNLKSIDVPSSVVWVGFRAFAGTNMESANIKASFVRPDSLGNCNDINIDNEDFLIEHSVLKDVRESNEIECRGVTLSLPIKMIGENALRGLSFLEVADFTGCTSLVSIGDNAFADNSVLSGVDLPKSVKEIGNGSFKNCPELNYLGVFDSDIDFGSENPFDDSTSFSLPPRIEKIGDYAFEGCNKIEEVKVPCSVKTIGRCAFPVNTKVSRDIKFKKEVSNKKCFNNKNSKKI